MIRRPILAVAILAGCGGAALAHHGWSDTQAEESRLAGRVETVYLGNPHAHMRVAATDGVWEVDLAPPSATRRAGLEEGMIKAGDRATFTGHRARDAAERVFKAETVTVGGRTFDVYPNREKSLKPEA